MATHQSNGLGLIQQNNKNTHRPQSPENDESLDVRLISIDKRYKVKYILFMKVFRWNHEKNIKLKKERGISFEDILFYIREGNLLSTIRQPSPAKYENQFIFIVNINNYAYAVPFIETEDEIFLKTIFPSRKYTKKYLEGNHEI